MAAHAEHRDGSTANRAVSSAKTAIDQAFFEGSLVS